MRSIEESTLILLQTIQSCLLVCETDAAWGRG